MLLKEGEKTNNLKLHYSVLPQLDQADNGEEKRQFLLNALPESSTPSSSFLHQLSSKTQSF